MEVRLGKEEDIEDRMRLVERISPVFPGLETAEAIEEHRQTAGALLSAALKELDGTREITVSTFREGDEKGIAPRALYKMFDFAEDGLVEEFGYPNQVFVRHPSER